MPFTRNKEDFICAHCGVAVTGTGYTNHCPRCLWSKHVDVFPGDRASPCQGMMRPSGVEVAREGYRIHHCCEKCGYAGVCDASKEDDFEEILRRSKMF